MTRGPSSFCLVTFLWQKFLITLQKLQTSSILSQAVAIGLATSQLPPIHDTSPISMTNLLQTASF
jgi:hypothetical protein